MSEPNLRWVQLQGTVDACSHARQDDAGVALEAFGAAVNERDDRAGIQNPVFVDQDGDLGRHAPQVNGRCYLTYACTLDMQTTPKS